ncbi:MULTISPECIES: PepSY domain-containing protein [unclassified Romboutsia]|uniref:PepSY domain-containing protein n=1 Tax=unclassified Romboutsia TaxID=2626894 RepID=UPI0008226114|nr:MULTISPECIES: PepSY domain-containing protein [unclassified Romboutsia]SCH93564.1 Uncharacterised protein [uncultured Clostridium sp.]
MNMNENKKEEKVNKLDIIEKIKLKKKKIKKSIIMILIFSIIGIGSVGIGVFSYAESKVNYTEDQLKEIALSKIPGDIIKVEKDFDDDSFTFEYEFKIKDENNLLREVTVNSNSGAIIDLDDNFRNSYKYD